MSKKTPRLIKIPIIILSILAVIGGFSLLGMPMIGSLAGLLVLFLGFWWIS